MVKHWIAVFASAALATAVALAGAHAQAPQKKPPPQQQATKDAAQKTKECEAKWPAERERWIAAAKEFEEAVDTEQVHQGYLRNCLGGSY